MMLKNRAARAITVVASILVMTTVADVADHQNMSTAAMTTETELAANGMAGVAAVMSQYEDSAYEYLELANASVQRADTVRVASAEENEEAAGTEQQEENAAAEDDLWQDRLMADVDDFLYVRESADPESEVVGKLYKGDVAQIQESGDEWTHITSGNVEGFVNNDYCVTGNEAASYAAETVDTQAAVLADGLRIRSEADAESSVISAVYTGTTLTVDTSAQNQDEEWVAVVYNGTTGYVSSDYVEVSLSLGEGKTIEEEQEEQARIAAEKAAQEAKEAAKKAEQVSSSSVQTVQNEAVTASTDDVTLLAAIIQCEAGNELYEGQVAVGAVVMNRVRAAGYPGSIYEVIYQRGQFPPAGNGSVAKIVSNGPKASCIQAAQEALNGTDNTSGATCFKRASSGHAGVVIGNHVFY